MNDYGKEIPHSVRVCSQTPSELSDWLSLVATDRDKDAFTQLFQFFAPKIKRFGRQKLNTDAMASELVQETMTRVWRKAHLYNSSKGAATTWVYTVMRNTCFDMLRKIKSNAEQSFSDDIWPIENSASESVSDSLGTEDNFKDHLMSKEILRHINKLPSAQKMVIEGIYFQELSQEQLSQQLGIPLGTVKSRLRIALSKLKQQMGDKYHD